MATKYGFPTRLNIIFQVSCVFGYHCTLHVMTVGALLPVLRNFTRLAFPLRFSHRNRPHLIQLFEMPAGIDCDVPTSVQLDCDMLMNVQTGPVCKYVKQPSRYHAIVHSHDFLRQMVCHSSWPNGPNGSMEISILNDYNESST